jgi:hypothetical protein
VLSLLSVSCHQIDETNKSLRNMTVGVWDSGVVWLKSTEQGRGYKEAEKDRTLDGTLGNPLCGLGPCRTALQTAKSCQDSFADSDWVSQRLEPCDCNTQARALSRAVIRTCITSQKWM